MLSSPFYTGQTTYGGASAIRRNSFTIQPTPRNCESQIAVKPVNEEREGVNMSQTARRILSALEELSTPLKDAKRIPTKAPPLAAKRRNVEIQSPGAKRPALEVPTVADMLKIRLEEIQDSTTMARKVTVAAREPSPPRWSGKIVTKQKDRGKPVNDPPPPPPELPKVPLQFTSLPKFELPVVVTPKVSEPVVIVKPEHSFAAPSAMPSDWKTSSTKDIEFTFSPPPTLTDWLKPKPLSSVMTPDAIAKLKRKTEKVEDSPVKELATGSVMDFLGKTAQKEVSGFGDKFKKDAGSWSCSTCLVNNPETHTKCLACETPKIGESKPKESIIPPVPIVSGGFGDKFKPVAGSWSCGSCMLNNSADAAKCVACETAKPGSEAPKLDGFGDKFKPASGSWTCDTCMVSNAGSAVKCVACETVKPGASNGQKVEPTNGPTETKPSFSFGIPSFKFGVDKPEVVSNGPKSETASPFSIKTSSGTFSFGIPPVQQTTNKSSVSDETDTSVAKSEEMKVSPPSVEPIKPSFSFGIVSTSAPTPSLPAPPAFSTGFSLNGPAFSSAPTEVKSFATTPAFSAPAQNSVVSEPEKPASVPFSFGASQSAPSSVFQFGKTSSESKSSEVFRFGGNSISQEPKTSEAAFPAFGSVFPTTTQMVSPSPTPAVFSFGKPVEGFGQTAPAPSMPFGTQTGSAKFSFGGPAATPAFNAPAPAFGAPAVNPPAFAAAAPAFAPPAVPNFTGFGGNPFGATPSPFGGANFGAFGQTAPAFPAAPAASTPFQFSAGNASAPAAAGPSVSLSIPPSFQFNIGQAPTT